MEAVELVRMSRPEVADASPQEAAAIKASFERKSQEEPSRLRAFLRRLTSRQIVAGIVALVLVPSGAYAVVEVLSGDRSEQVEQAIDTIGPSQLDRQKRQREGLIEGCRDLQAQGLKSKNCTALLDRLDQGEGKTSPEP